MTFLGLLIVAIIFFPFVLKRHREKMEWEEEQDRRERQRDADLHHIASGRSGPPPQVKRLPDRDIRAGRYRQNFLDSWAADWIFPPILAFIILWNCILALIESPRIESTLDWVFFGPLGLRPIGFLIALVVFLATCVAIRRLKDRFRAKVQNGIK